MPALIRNSSALNSKGIVLISQTAEEQPTGLVRVNVDYLLTDTYAKQLGNIFMPDSRPPIMPNLYVEGQLDGGLFLESHSVEKFAGQWRVAASYVGARKVATRFRGFITRDNEARVTPPYRIGDFTVSVRFVAQTITTSLASVARGYFDVEETSTNRFELRSMISRVQYGVISLAGTDLSSTDRQQVINFNVIPPAGFIFNSFGPAIVASTSIENVTNSVIIGKTKREIVFLRGAS